MWRGEMRGLGVVSHGWNEISMQLYCWLWPRCRTQSYSLFIFTVRLPEFLHQIEHVSGTNSVLKSIRPSVTIIYSTLQTNERRKERRSWVPIRPTSASYTCGLGLKSPFCNRKPDWRFDDFSSVPEEKCSGSILSSDSIASFSTFFPVHSSPVIMSLDA